MLSCSFGAEAKRFELRQLKTAFRTLNRGVFSVNALNVFISSHPSLSAVSPEALSAWLETCKPQCCFIADLRFLESAEVPEGNISGCSEALISRFGPWAFSAFWMLGITADCALGDVPASIGSESNASSLSPVCTSGYTCVTPISFEWGRFDQNKTFI